MLIQFERLHKHGSCFTCAAYRDGGLCPGCEDQGDPTLPEGWAHFARQEELRRRMLWLKWTVIFPCALALVIALFLLFSAHKAHAADGRVCYYITSLPRNCESVQKVVNRYGHRLAFWFARRCGATEQDIKEAETCLRKPGT